MPNPQSALALALAALSEPGGVRRRRDHHEHAGEETSKQPLAAMRVTVQDPWAAYRPGARLSRFTRVSNLVQDAIDAHLAAPDGFDADLHSQLERVHQRLKDRIRWGKETSLHIDSVTAALAVALADLRGEPATRTPRQLVRRHAQRILNDSARRGDQPPMGLSRWVSERIILEFAAQAGHASAVHDALETIAASQGRRLPAQDVAETLLAETLGTVEDGLDDDVECAA